MQVELKTFQQQLLILFTNQQERNQFLQTHATEYATYKNIEALPKKPVTLYAQLLTSTADGTMSSIFPAIRTFYSDDQWLNLLEKYFGAYKQPHYRLNSIAQNFSSYLAESASERFWLSEIADYEYQELSAEENEAEASIADFTQLQSQSEIMALSPILNQTVKRCAYSFDVTETVGSILDGEELSMPPSLEPTKVVFFRDPSTHRCRQLKLGALADLILLTSHCESLTYAQILQKCLIANTDTTTATVEEKLSEMLEIFNDFHAVNLFTGNFKSA